MWVILLYVKKRIFAVLLCLFLLVPMPALASTSAQSAVVMDAAGHTVLYEQNAYEERPMASTTKIMTAYLACAAGDLQRWKTQRARPWDYKWGIGSLCTIWW